MKALRFSLIPLVVLFANAAFAQELPKAGSPDDRVKPQLGGHFRRPASMQREVAPLLYLLPSLETKEPATMEIRILQGKRQLISEVVKLPGSVADGATIDVLFTHPSELKRLRAIEALQPGSLRFLALVAGRAVTDKPFASIEAQGAKLSIDTAVGEISEIDSRPAAKPRAGTLFVHALDQCTDDCDAQYMSCLDWCDERSNSCYQCWLDYQSCSSNCQPSCTEPKSTSDYSTSTFTNVSYYGYDTCYALYSTNAPTEWQEFYVTRQVTTYHRVVHCDNSYTDTQTGQSSTSYWCWYDTGNACTTYNTISPFPIC